MCAKNYEKLLRVDKVITTNTMYGFLAQPVGSCFRLSVCLQSGITQKNKKIVNFNKFLRKISFIDKETISYFWVDVETKFVSYFRLFVYLYEMRYLIAVLQLLTA